MAFSIVCGAHLGGLRHDDSGGAHSINTAFAIAVAVALVLQAAASGEGVETVPRIPHRRTVGMIPPGSRPPEQDTRAYGCAARRPVMVPRTSGGGTAPARGVTHQKEVALSGRDPWNKPGSEVQNLYWLFRT
jgi:hypothetical protein